MDKETEQLRNEVSLHRFEMDLKHTCFMHTPSAKNWRELTDAMLVYQQSWQQLQDKEHRLRNSIAP